MGIDEDAAVIAADARGVMRFIAITIAALMGVGSILYAMGLAPLSNMQFEQRLNDLNIRRDSQIVELEKRINDRMDQRFLTLPQYEEFVRAQKM